MSRTNTPSKGKTYSIERDQCKQFSEPQLLKVWDHSLEDSKLLLHCGKVLHGLKSNEMGEPSSASKQTKMEM
jgi:hypothetical protein